LNTKSYQIQAQKQPGDFFRALFTAFIIFPDLSESLKISKLVIVMHKISFDLPFAVFFNA